MKVTDRNIKQILHKAVDILKGGGIIAYPTETFYGLGVKFDMEDSLKRLYKIKQRPLKMAIPLIIGNRDLLSVIAASMDKTAISLTERFWPAPLTVIFPAKENLSEFITAKTRKVAVRMPGNSFALRLAEYAGFPITATSANPSGARPAQDMETIRRYFDDELDLIIDDGTTPGGLPSTIVDVEGDEIKILREGAIEKALLIAARKK